MGQQVKKGTAGGRKHKRKKSWSGIYFILPSFAGVLIFVLIPYLDVIRRAFTQAATGKFVGLANFITVFENKAFILAVKNTFYLTVVCVPVLVTISLVMAVFLQKKTTITRVLKSSYLIPMAIPVAPIVLMWRLIFDKNGFLNGILQITGGTKIDWMNTKYAFWILAGSYIWKNLGYSIVLWLAGLSAISKDIYEAAKVDGAGGWVCFWSITLPNLYTTLYTITVLSVINLFKVFREAYLVAGDYPDKSMYLLQHLFSNWFRELSMDKIAAGAIVNTLVLFGLVILFWNKYGGKE